MSGFAVSGYIGIRLLSVGAIGAVDMDWLELSCLDLGWKSLRAI